MVTEWHGPFVQGFQRALCMLLWNLCSQFLCLHIFSLTTFPRWPATSRFWAWSTCFADFRLWNVTLDHYLFIYSTEIKASLFFSRVRSYTCKKLVWWLHLQIPNTRLDWCKFLGPSLQEVLKGDWITASLWHILILCFRAFTGCLWAKTDYFFLFLSWCINCLIGIFFVWLLFFSSNDQPTGNRPHV